MPSLAAKLLAAANVLQLNSINVGENTPTDTLYGYNNTTLNPGEPTFGLLNLVIRNVIAAAMYSQSGTLDLLIILDAAGLGQNYFQAIYAQQPAGGVRQFLTSAATYASGGGLSRWSWGTGTNLLYPQSSVGNVYNFWVSPF